MSLKNRFTNHRRTADKRFFITIVPAQSGEVELFMIYFLLSSVTVPLAASQPTV